MTSNHDCNTSLMLISRAGVSDSGPLRSSSQYTHGWEASCRDGPAYPYPTVLSSALERSWCSGFCPYPIDFYSFLECGCGFCSFSFISCINLNDLGVPQMFYRVS